MTTGAKRRIIRLTKAKVEHGGFQDGAELPYLLRHADFAQAMEDIYAFFFEVNSLLVRNGLERLENSLAAATLSGMLSGLLTHALAKASRGLVVNGQHNGHPDLVKRGEYANNSIVSGREGVEVKSTVSRSGAVDTHGARDQWICVFTYEIDKSGEAASKKKPLQFTKVFLARVRRSDFRENARKTKLGTRTATLNGHGLRKLRAGLVYSIDR